MRIATLMLLLMLAGLAGSVLLNSAFFDVAAIEVYGTVRLQKEEVIAASLLMPGMRIWNVSPSSTEDLVESLVWVKDARVQLVFPATVRIRITERTPMALLPEGRAFLLVDAEGVILERTEDLSSVTLPLITGAVPGDDPRPFQWADDCLKMLSQRSIEVSEINVSGGSITVYLMDGTRVLLGEYDFQLEDKIELLKQILKDVTRDKLPVSYVDLRYPNKPVIGLQP